MIVLFLTTSSVYSQEAKWQQMEDFHAVMSVTFHPAEDDNLQPLKEKSGDLSKPLLHGKKVPYHKDIMQP